MKATETHLKGCYLIEPQKIEDSRGYFFESFNADTFKAITNTETVFVQDNQSYSRCGVIRGLHAQAGEFAQAKLVRVLQGTVLDVVVDVRVDSPTFGQHMAVELSAENNLQVFVPRGFLHGFSVLSETALFFYKCDNLYDKASEYGVLYNDPALAIDWQITKGSELISEKDVVLPLFETLFVK